MDIEINVDVSSVSYRSWLRTSYMGSSISDKNGMPMIEDVELGLDQEDAFNDFLSEASKKVLGLFTSRQATVNGLPYESSATELTYRFKEGEPSLPANLTTSLTTTLTEDTKEAVYSYISYLWFGVKNMQNVSAEYMAKYIALSDNIERLLYKLHD